MARYNTYNCRSSRIERIERKCDRILSELLIIRHQLHKRPDMDEAIDRLHATALKLREQVAREKEIIQRMCNSNARNNGR